MSQKKASLLETFNWLNNGKGETQQIMFIISLLWKDAETKLLADTILKLQMQFPLKCMGFCYYVCDRCLDSYTGMKLFQSLWEHIYWRLSNLTYHPLFSIHSPYHPKAFSSFKISSRSISGTKYWFCFTICQNKTYFLWAWALILLPPNSNLEHPK